MSKSARNEHKWSFDGKMKLPKNWASQKPYVEHTPRDWKLFRIEPRADKYAIIWRSGVSPGLPLFTTLEEAITQGVQLERHYRAVAR